MPIKYEYSGSQISQEEWDAAIHLAESYKDGRVGGLRTLSRALLHLKVCYDELVKLHAEDVSHDIGERS